MHKSTRTTLSRLLTVLFVIAAADGFADGLAYGERGRYLADLLPSSELREKLLECRIEAPRRSALSIGHRGAPLRYAEHSRESYLAAIEGGAGSVECDVTPSLDGVLLCRHDTCDLHRTTNVLSTPLARKCRQPFSAAVLDDNGELVKAADALCCTTEFTEDEFLSLTARQDRINESASSISEYLLSDVATGTPMTHKQSIELLVANGVAMVPELKAVPGMAPDSDVRRKLAQKLVDDYRDAGVLPERVRLQSFHPEDIQYWIAHEPDFARHAVFLDGRYTIDSFDHRDPESWNPPMQGLYAMGVRTLAPPLWMLLDGESGLILPSIYAKEARAAGLELVTWTLERSPDMEDGGGWYYQTLNGLNGNLPGGRSMISSDGDILQVLDHLVQDVGVQAVFSDWPETVAWYDHCVSEH